MVLRGKQPRLLAISGLIMAVIAVAALIALTATPAKGVEKTEPLSAAQAFSETFAQIAEKVSPAVVFIAVAFIEVEKELKGSPAGFYGPGAGPMDPQGFFRFFFGPGMGEQGDAGTFDAI
jgi:S1-C subfamily serine protease